MPLFHHRHRRVFQRQGPPPEECPAEMSPNRKSLRVSTNAVVCAEDRPRLRHPGAMPASEDWPGGEAMMVRHIEIAVQ
jgi:hypothetical protein